MSLWKTLSAYMGVFPIIGISKLERIVNATIQCIKQADKSKTKEILCVCELRLVHTYEASISARKSRGDASTSARRRKTVLFLMLVLVLALPRFTRTFSCAMLMLASYVWTRLKSSCVLRPITYMFHWCSAYLCPIEASPSSCQRWNYVPVLLPKTGCERHKGVEPSAQESILCSS